MSIIDYIISTFKPQKLYDESKNSTLNNNNNNNSTNPDYFSSKQTQEEPLQTIKDEKNPFFESGKKYRLFYEHWSKTLEIELIDKELCDGYNARVTNKIKGPFEAMEDWSKGKTPYSDLETRTTQYIIKKF